MKLKTPQTQINTLLKQEKWLTFRAQKFSQESISNSAASTKRYRLCNRIYIVICASKLNHHLVIHKFI